MSEVFFDNVFDFVFILKDRVFVVVDFNIIFEINFKILDILDKVDFVKEFLGKMSIFY